ncbi:MAG: transcription elongation factor GreA [Gammaproteobacteria bacterium]
MLGSTKVPITARGAEQLRDELKRLKGYDRPQVIKAIAEARAHGDLRENAEYHAAKEQQGFIEARIKDIEGKLAHAQIIDVTQFGAAGKVIFGATVEVCDEERNARITYRIVGEDEADIKSGLVSVNSPIARALIGKHEGNVVDVIAPGGTRSYEIVAVRYE